jgi:AcrR family transcriptional regulator
MSRRASPQDWCAAGLALLRDEGIDAVTVDRLCSTLKKTKGSFYHHFRDRDAYLAALLARWEEDLTEAPIRAAGREPDPLRQSARLDSVVRGLDHGLDRAVRAWALRDPPARAAMRRVDQRRIDYIAELYRRSGRRQPRLLAELKYMAFVGAQHLGIFASPARTARLGQALNGALARRGEARRSGSARAAASAPGKRA